MPKTKAKSTKVRYHRILELPPLPPDQYAGLRDSIAIHGVLVPIGVDSDGPKRGIIDGIYRKQFADEFGYDCPEVVYGGLDEEEKRTLARALNLARRQLNNDQKRQIITDQLRETPDRTNRWVAKMLGVSHPTVASVRADLEAVGKVFQQGPRVGSDGKTYKATKIAKVVARPAQKNRMEAVTLIHGECRKVLKTVAAKSIDAIITDSIYPEVDREYGRISEKQWHELMHTVVNESRRVLKPKGSAVFILQPNFERVGKMRLWLWDFVAWAGREWNLVQDAYCWSINTLPSTAANRKNGLMRQSMKWCVWLGAPDCYRSQDNVLWEPSDAIRAEGFSDRCLRRPPSGHGFRRGRIAQTCAERGGATPFNIIPYQNHVDDHGHPAATPYELASWWCRYILPPGGVLLDPFCGSGTMLAAGVDHGASKVIGIDKEKKYLRMAAKRFSS